MWTRRDLKQRAKNVLRWNYWKAFLISLVLAIASGGGGGGGGGAGGQSFGEQSSNQYGNIDIRTLLIIAAVAIVGTIIIAFIAVALRIFLGYPLEVGGRRFFVRSAENTDNRKCFRFAFDGQNYINIIKTMLLKGIQNFLWFLLFFFPGIVKSYSYSMVPYILGDNPNIGARRAIQLSNDMTHGHKMDMFILDLSFLGWYLLGMLALVIGMLFVKPYEDATKAELYLTLRQNALNNNMCTYHELGIAEDGGFGL